MAGGHSGGLHASGCLMTEFGVDLKMLVSEVMGGGLFELCCTGRERIDKANEMVPPALQANKLAGYFNFFKKKPSCSTSLSLKWRCFPSLGIIVQRKRIAGLSDIEEVHECLRQASDDTNGLICKLSAS